MELTLTKDQKKYLAKKGIISADDLQHAYRKSVQEQKAIKEQASKIRGKKR
jgi:hypothetical protein